MNQCRQRENELRMKTLVFALFAVVTSIISGGSFGQEAICGPVPALPTTAEAAESVKGNLKGQADFLSKLVGKAELAGEIEATKKQIYQNTDKFFAAQKDAYLAYIFCVIIMKDGSLSTPQKLDALKQYKKAPTPTSMHSYSYLNNAATLIEKDISIFQNIPKQLVDGKLIGIVHNYPENIIVNGKPRILYLNIYYFVETNYLKRLNIEVDNFSEDCAKTEDFKISFSINENIWGRYRRASEMSGGNGTSFSYCGKDQTYMTFNVVWDRNPSKIENATYICRYYNNYFKYYDDLFYRC